MAAVLGGLAGPRRRQSKDYNCLQILREEVNSFAYGHACKQTKVGRSCTRADKRHLKVLQTLLCTQFFGAKCGCLDSPACFASDACSISHLACKVPACNVS